MTRSSRPSFPPQILLRQSRARSLALFSDLISAPIYATETPQTQRRKDRRKKRREDRRAAFSLPSFSSSLCLRCLCGNSFRRLLGKTEPILLLRVAHVGAPDNLLEVDLFIRERSVAEGGRLLTQPALE